MKRTPLFLVLAVTLLSLDSSSLAQDEDLRNALRIGQELAIKAASDVDAVRAKVESKGALIAEGDSWFDYPGSDILRELNKKGYDIYSVAKAGDTAENMVYGPDSLQGLAEKFELLSRREIIPVGILLSAGGNDIAGPELSMLFNHRRSESEPLDMAVVNRIIHERLRNAIVSLIAAADQLRRRYFGEHKIPIIIHGYGCPVPDGRGFWGGWFFLPGPWLEPSLKRKGLIENGDLSEAKALMCRLIQEFNVMLDKLPAQTKIDDLRHVNLLETLSNRQNDYKEWWKNELHATKNGLEAIANRFDSELRRP